MLLTDYRYLQNTPTPFDHFPSPEPTPHTGSRGDFDRWPYEMELVPISMAARFMDSFLDLMNTEKSETKDTILMKFLISEFVWPWTKFINSCCRVPDSVTGVISKFYPGSRWIIWINPQTNLSLVLGEPVISYIDIFSAQNPEIIFCIFLP